MRLAALLLSAMLTFSGGARADAPRATSRAESRGALGEQSALLAEKWGSWGEVLRPRSRLLDQGESRPVLVPPTWLDPAVNDCVTVAVLGTQNLSFLLTFDLETVGHSARAWPIPSAAGLAEVTRCGAQKEILLGLATEMRSRRGVADYVILRSADPPPPASELLAGRNAGPSLPSPQVGGRPFLAPRKERLAALHLLHRNRGAEALRESGLTGGADGNGTAIIHLSPGCHQLDFLAEADRLAPPDLDARLYTLSSGEELAVDQEHSDQASLRYCVGRQERFRIDFTGARPGSEITLLEARYALPGGIPLAWGPMARASLARAMWLDTLPHVEEPPLFSSLGIRGATELSVETDPDACFLLAVAPLRGDVSRLSLGAEAGGVPRTASSLEPRLGTSLTFCAEGKEKVLLQVQATGSGVAWILGLFRMSSQKGVL